MPRLLALLLTSCAIGASPAVHAPVDAALDAEAPADVPALSPDACAPIVPARVCDLYEATNGWPPPLVEYAMACPVARARYYGDETCTVFSLVPENYETWAYCCLPLDAGLR